MHLEICFELHWSCCSDMERLLLMAVCPRMKISTTKISPPDLKGGSLKPKHDQPVNSWYSIMGAIGGPCNGHLVVSQTRLVESSAVGQLNSSPCLSQTWAKSPAQNVFYHKVNRCLMRYSTGSFSAQKCIFGPKINVLETSSIFLIPSWQDTKNTPFLCWLLYMVGLGAAAGAKKQHFWPKKKATLGNRSCKKRPAERPNGYLPENRGYPELAQDMVDLWFVRSVWAEKMEIMWV